jgi:hypothetical protein
MALRTVQKHPRSGFALFSKENPSGRLGLMRVTPNCFFRINTRALPVVPSDVLPEEANGMRPVASSRGLCLTLGRFKFRSAAHPSLLPCFSMRLDFGRRWPRVPFAGTHWHACLGAPAGGMDLLAILAAVRFPCPLRSPQSSAVAVCQEYHALKIFGYRHVPGLIACSDAEAVRNVGDWS